LFLVSGHRLVGFLRLGILLKIVSDVFHEGFQGKVFFIDLTLLQQKLAGRGEFGREVKQNPHGNDGVK
jgi:hypothetical protein